MKDTGDLTGLSKKHIYEQL